jgi:hypothetical protein
VWHILDDGEFVLVLANAAHVKNMPGRKTDVNDVTWLAELLAPDPGEFRSGSAHPGDAQPDAHAQAVGSRAIEASAAGAKDA